MGYFISTETATGLLEFKLRFRRSIPADYLDVSLSAAKGQRQFVGSADSRVQHFIG